MNFPLPSDPRADHRVAAEASVAAVRPIIAADLDRPTPCSAWNVRALLGHMITQNRGFAAAMRGAEADWELATLGPDPAGDYAAATAELIDAFDTADALTRPVRLTELSTEITFTGQQACTMHLIDSLVHAWDVSRSLGREPEPLPELWRRALPVIEAIPDDEGRRRPGASFAPALPAGSASDAAAPADRALRLLGRDPAWTPPTD